MAETKKKPATKPVASTAKVETKAVEKVVAPKADDKEIKALRAELDSVKSELEVARSAKEKAEKEVVETEKATYKFAKLNVVNAVVSAVLAVFAVIAVIYFSWYVSNGFEVTLTLYNGGPSFGAFTLSAILAGVFAAICTAHSVVSLVCAPKYKK